MTYAEAMKQLKTMGTAQNRKIYARHGVRGEMFGVSYANLGKLKKSIRVDHGLAGKLWASGVHDARVLAAQIADPAAVKSSELDAWARDLDDYVLTDAFSGFVAKSPHAVKKLEKWTKGRGEWTGQAGWNVVTILAGRDGALADAECEKLLGTIEAGIHGRKNRVRYAMLLALIAIGIRSDRLEKKAGAAAKRIGPVEVDHGETGCKTPDPIPYMRKARDRAKARAGAGKKPAKSRTC